MIGNSKNEVKLLPIFKVVLVRNEVGCKQQTTPVWTQKEFEYFLLLTRLERGIHFQEAHEREWREKEHAEAEKIRRMNEQLLVAREQQKIMKARQLADQVCHCTFSYIHT